MNTASVPSISSRTEDAAAQRGRVRGSLPPQTARNQALTEVRQQLSHQMRGRCGRAADPACAHRMLLPRAGDFLSEQARGRVKKVFTTDTPTRQSKQPGVEEYVGTLLRTGSLEVAGLVLTPTESRASSAI